MSSDALKLHNPIIVNLSYHNTTNYLFYDITILMYVAVVTTSSDRDVVVPSLCVMNMLLYFARRNLIKICVIKFMCFLLCSVPGKRTECGRVGIGNTGYRCGVEVDQ